MNNVTCDEISAGGLKLLQPAEGVRVNMDTVLLSSWVKIRAGHHEVLEAGCASGAVSLMLAVRHKNIHVTGVDIQPELVELAELNAKNNALSDRVKFIHGDLRDKNIFPRECFDVLVINPPYESTHAGRPSPDASRTTARLEITCTPDDVAELSSRVLKSNGRMFAVFTSERLDVFMSAMMRKKIIPKRLLPVYPKKNHNSSVFLIECVKNGGEGLMLLSPLLVRDENNEYTPELLRAYDF